MSKLTKYKFSDLYEMSSGISSSKAQSGHGSPFVSFSTVFNNYFLPEELSDLMNTSIKEQEIYSVKKDDVFITRTSETVDALAMSCVAIKDYPKATFSGFVKRLRPKTTGIVYSKYIAFFLRSKYFRKVLDCNTIMTLRASFNEDIFSFLYVYLPDYEEQVRIGDLLYKIEMKVRTNNKINDNLEQQAKLLYDYWFTQFDFPDSNGKPYCSSGGQMKWNEELKRNIPIGWEVKRLGDLLTKNTDAFDYQSVQPAIDLSVMPSDSISLSQINTSENFATNLFNMKTGDILFGSIRPYLHKAGIAPCDGVVAGTVHSYRVKQHKDYNFALITMCRSQFFDYAVNVSSGTKMPVVSNDALLDYKVAYSHKVVKAFNQIVLQQTITQAVMENQSLTALRDWLLPMLMNGQATISD